MKTTINQCPVQYNYYNAHDVGEERRTEGEVRE
jgi:hypothetical protein